MCLVTDNNRGKNPQSPACDQCQHQTINAGNGIHHDADAQAPAPHMDAANTSFSIPSLKTIVLWSILTYVSKEFSLFLPKHQSKAGANTFISAAYHYDDELSFFDNTFLTWGTDYGICVIMLYATFQCLTATTLFNTNNHTNGNINKNTNSSTSTSTSTNIIQYLDTSRSKPLRIKAALLFFSYALSVFAGGYAHYTFTEGTEQRNTTEFRIWWTICVGSVTAAGGFMGSCGSEIYKWMNQSQCRENVRFRIGSGYVHDLLWGIYAGFLTYVCIMGDISYQRPACDIFVAGTSQFIPTVYCILTVLSVRWNDANPILEGQLNEHEQSQEQSHDNINTNTSAKEVRRWYRYMFYIGFILNVPLLPSYPCFVQYTSLSLGMVNAILHMNLTLAWGMQAWGMRHFCQALNLVDVGVDRDQGLAAGGYQQQGRKKDQ